MRCVILLGIDGTSLRSDSGEKDFMGGFSANILPVVTLFIS